MPLPADPVVPAESVRARAARLEARLAVYAQYASVVAEQAAAAVAGDVARTEALAVERERVAEHFDELRAPTGAGDTGPGSFRAALDDALAELAHQGAVDSALGARLAALREAVLRGAEWGAGGEPLVPAARMLPAPKPEAVSATPGRSTIAADDAVADEAPDRDPVNGVLGGALVAARAAGVGGVLGGQYPGRAARDDYPAGWPVEGGAAEGAAARLDIRF